MRALELLGNAVACILFAAVVVVSAPLIAVYVTYQNWKESTL